MRTENVVLVPIEIDPEKELTPAEIEEEVFRNKDHVLMQCFRQLLRDEMSLRFSAGVDPNGKRTKQMLGGVDALLTLKLELDRMAAGDGEKG